MSIPGSSHEIFAAAVREATESQKEEFKALWLLFLESVRDGKPQILVPEMIGNKLGGRKLAAIAEKYRFNIKRPVRVVLDSAIKAYRIGEAEDLPFGVPGQLQIFDTAQDGPASDDEIWDPLKQYEDSDWDSDDSDIEKDIASIPEDLPPYQAGIGGGSSVSNHASAKDKPPKLPKPANSFILYRKAKQPIVLEKDPNLHCSKVSQVIGEMWRGEAPEVKAEFQRQADEQKRLFMEKNPDWKCAPRKSSDIWRRKSPQKTGPGNSAPISSSGFPRGQSSSANEKAHRGPNRTVNTMDVNNFHSPGISTGHQTGSMAIDLGASDGLDQAWLRSLPSITPIYDGGQRRRDRFLRHAEELHGGRS